MTKIVLLLVVALLIGGFSGQQGLKYPTGAPAGYTGSPGDGKNCTSCHGGTATNTSGIITTDIPPTGYVAGYTYNITVTVTGTGKKGFQLSPQKPTGEQVGTLLPGTASQVLSGGKYITHTQASTASTATWNFQWQAPSQPGTGPVTFYLAHVRNKPNVFLSNLTVEENYHVGQPEASQGEGLRVWPNPVNGVFNVSFFASEDSEANLSLIPVNGGNTLPLFSGRANLGLNYWQLNRPEQASPGLYLLRIQLASCTLMTKILIQK